MTARSPLAYDTEDTITLEAWRRHHPARSADDRPPSMPRPIRRGTRPPGPAASTAPADHDAPVEKGEPPP